MSERRLRQSSNEEEKEQEKVGVYSNKSSVIKYAQEYEEQKQEEEVALPKQTRSQDLYQNLVRDERNDSLFPTRQENMSKFWKFGHKFDIFGFEPVPKSTLVSSRRSQIASIVAIVLMLAYVGYTIYDFFFNNTPRLNTYTVPIDFNQEFKALDFAFGFYEMDTSSNLIDDPSIFTYYLEQYIYSNIPGEGGHEELSKMVATEICTPTWAPVQIKMLCPKEQMYMQGMIGKGDYLKYPRLKILACNPLDGVVCNQGGAISEFPKGRLFVFIKQEEQINFATDVTQPESGIFYYYFIVPQYYDRAETTIQRNIITKYPNYGSSFTDTVYTYQSVINNNLYVSDVSYFFQTDNSAPQQKQSLSGNSDSAVNTSFVNSNSFSLKDAVKQSTLNGSNKNLQNKQSPQILKNQQVKGRDKVDPVSTQPYFAWWMSISPTQVEVEVNYKTSANMISLWGGLWGVIVAAFTFVYMTYNAKQFYKQHKEWDRFDNVIQVNRLSTFMLNKDDPPPYSGQHSVNPNQNNNSDQNAEQEEIRQGSRRSIN